MLVSPPDVAIEHLLPPYTPAKTAELKIAALGVDEFELAPASSLEHQHRGPVPFTIDYVRNQARLVNTHHRQNAAGILAAHELRGGAPSAGR